MMLLDELVCFPSSLRIHIPQISSIGCERDTGSESVSSKFPWIADSNVKPPKSADQSLASSIRSGESLPTELLVSGIIRLSFSESAEAALQSVYISEREAMRLLSTFGDLLGVFLESNNFSADRLRQTLHEDMSDEALARIVTQCTVYLEECLSAVTDKREEVSRYIRFVSIIVDSKYVTWYVKSGALGGPLARLAALINRYRRSLFDDQQARAKAADSEIESTLRRKTDASTDGRIFYHQLK